MKTYEALRNVIAAMGVTEELGCSDQTVRNHLKAEEEKK